MRRILHRCIAALIVAGLAAVPANAGAVFVPIIVPMQVSIPAAQTAEYDRIHTIAILPALGDSMELQNFHFMGTKTKPLDIAAWNLDGLAGAVLQKYLSSRFAVKTVAYDRAAIAALPNGPFANSRLQLRKILGAIPNDGIDAFVVVRPDLEYGAPGTEGLSLNIAGAPVVWANYEIDLVDARTYDTIAKSYSRVTYRLGEGASFANIIAPEAVIMDDGLTPDPRQAAILRVYSAHLISASIVETLRSLGMGLLLPMPGDRVLVPIPPEKKPFPAFKSVALFSVIGDQITLEHSGMFFAHGSYPLAVTDWHVDDAVTKTIAANLDKRFTVKPASADMMALQQAHVLDADGKSDPKFPGLTASQDVDAYIVAVKIHGACPIGQHSCDGIGLINSTLPADSATGVFANYALAVIDAHTLKWLAWQAGMMPPSRAKSRPFSTVPDVAWPDKPPVMNAEQMSTVHTALDDVLKDSIPETMMGLGLTGMMVQPDLASVPTNAASQNPPTTSH
jgi:hypothetical protein